MKEFTNEVSDVVLVVLLVIISSILILFGNQLAP